MKGELATLTVMAPLLAAIIVYVLPRRGPAIGISTSMLLLGATLTLAVELHVSGAEVVALGAWGAPMGIRWRLDGLAATMLTLTASVALALSIYATAYFRETSAGKRFWSLWLLLLGGLNGLYLSADLFNLYVTLEVVGLSAVTLVTLADSRAADRAAFQYLLVSLLGSLLYLAGVALIYRAYGTLDLLLLGAAIEANPLTGLALTFMSIGLLLKAALFPLHFWLPPAHGSAPAPAHAALSSLVVKGAIYLLLRLQLEAFPFDTPFLDLLLALAGSGAVLWGSICALLTPRLKLLVAYSTVAQLGYVLLWIPLAHSAAADLALAGILYFIIAHACAKAAMLMAAGNLQTAAGHDNIEGLRPLAVHLPMTMAAFALGGASIMGLPPSGGFIAKWTLLNAGLLAGQWHVIVVIALGGLLSAAYVFRVLNLAFRTGDPAAEEAALGHELQRRVGAAAQWTPLLLGLIAVALGFNALPVLDLLGVKLAEAGAP